MIFNDRVKEEIAVRGYDFLTRGRWDITLRSQDGTSLAHGYVFFVPHASYGYVVNTPVVLTVLVSGVAYFFDLTQGDFLLRGTVGERQAHYITPPLETQVGTALIRIPLLDELQERRAQLPAHWLGEKEIISRIRDYKVHQKNVSKGIYMTGTDLICGNTKLSTGCTFTINSFTITPERS